MANNDIETFIKKYEQLVCSRVARFLSVASRHNRNHYFDDIKQTAYLALIEAYHKYNESYGVPEFIYVCMQIDFAIKREFDNLNPVKLRDIAKINSILKTKNILDNLYNGKSPGNIVAMWEEMSESKIDYYLNMYSSHVPVQLDMLDNIDASAENEEKIIDYTEMAILLKKYGDNFVGRDEMILNLLYKDGCTLSEAGEHLGIKKQTVAKVRDRILGKLRELMKDDED